jgi:hypothetical protein
VKYQSLTTGESADLENRFGYHPPENDDRKVAHELVRERCLDLATAVLSLAPSSRERSLAVTSLEEAMFWANAAIARVSENGERRVS